MIERTFRCESLKGLNQVVSQLPALLGTHRVVAFYGDMGSGKTTLINAICKTLNMEGNAVSPTFSIVNEYITANNEIIYHFDFYRIKSLEEAMDIGYENYFYSGDWCFIEWPEKIKELLPAPHAQVFISSVNEERIIKVIA